MQTEPYRSQRTPAEWSGARLLVDKWLAKQCAVESFVNFLSGVLFALAGIIALVFTSGVMAALVFLILGYGSLLFAFFGLPVSLLRPFFFGLLFLTFFVLSAVHAYKTRWESEGKVLFGTPLMSMRSVIMEFFSAGPILIVLAVQDFQRYARLSRLDIPQVSTLLLWLFDKGGRATFAEISLAFPGINVVRVLPQLRDLPGVSWWPEEGEISISETLRDTFENILHREPKTSRRTFKDRPDFKRPDFKQTTPEVDQEILSWYAALDLPIFTPLQRVKARYRKLAKMYHPDARSAAGRLPGGDEEMKRINAAYHNILKHSQNRAGNVP